MISLARCKKMLNKNGLSYTDEEVEKAGDVLYKLAHIQYEIMTRLKIEGKLDEFIQELAEKRQ